MERARELSRRGCWLISSAGVHGGGGNAATGEVIRYWDDELRDGVFGQVDDRTCIRALSSRVEGAVCGDERENSEVQAISSSWALTRAFGPELGGLTLRG